MESILLYDKYAVIDNFEPTILLLDWEAAPLLTEMMIQIQIRVEPVLGYLAQGFLDMDGDVLSMEIRAMVGDIATCAQVSESLQTQPIVDANHQRWLFLRHQAVVARLLASQPYNLVEKSVRIALIIWLSKTTAYFGAQ